MKTQLKKAALTCVIDNNSFKYTYVMLNSLLKNNEYLINNELYDIICVLNNKLNDNYTNMLLELSNNLKFIDPSNTLKNDAMSKAWKKRFNYALCEQYFFNRFIIFDLIKNYETIIYLDGDMLIINSIYDLIHNDKTFDIGACLTIRECYGYNLSEILGNNNYYCIKYTHINGGVICVNNSFYQKINFDKFMQIFYDSLNQKDDAFKFINIECYKYGDLRDEDFLNYLIHTYALNDNNKMFNFKILDQSYNINCWLLNYGYNDINKMKIIHYLTKQYKPWNYPNQKSTELWYKYKTLSNID